MATKRFGRVSNWIKYCICGEKHRRIYLACLLILLFCSNVLAGSLYIYGNIQPYLVSYIRERSQPSSLRYTQSTYLFSTHYAGYGIGFALCGLLESKFGVRVSYISGAILAVLGLLLSYFTIQVSFWLLLLTYGVMYSVGVGVLFFSTIICAVQWFPKRAGIAIGFVMSGTGLGGLAFAAIQTGFINQNNEFPDNAPYEQNPDEKYFTQTELINRFPFIFLIMGSIALLITTVTLFFIANPMSHEPVAIGHDDSGTRKHRDEKFRFIQMIGVLFSVECYIQIILYIQNVIVFGVIASLYKTYGLEVLKSSDYFLTALGGVANGIFNIFGRFLFGFLSDKVGYKMAYAVQSGMMAILLSTLYITSLGYPAMYFIWVCGIVMSYGGCCTLSIVAILKHFGSDHFNINCAVIATTAQVIGSFLYGVVSDFCVDYLDWSGTFLLLGRCIATIQIFLVLMLSKNDHEPTAEKHYTRNPLFILNCIQ